MSSSDFLTSDYGRLVRHRKLKTRRIVIATQEFEPTNKASLPEAQGQAFRALVDRQLRKQHRAPFRGCVALELVLGTSVKNAPHAASIAKNLLDLLATRDGKRGLYMDDRQVEALSVRCWSGLETPWIFITAAPLHGFLEDLKMAVEMRRRSERLKRDNSSDAIERLATLVEDRRSIQFEPHQQLYDQFISMARREAQEHLLGLATWPLEQVSWLYDPHPIDADFVRDVGMMLLQHPLRIQLDQLPERRGDSAAFRSHVARKLRGFKSRLRHILDPLLQPIALEVFIRPSATQSEHVIHDVDNVLRNYLIPSVINLLEPPAHTAGLSVGISRYQVWRLPPNPQGPGFVNLAVVADTYTDGIFHQVDEAIESR